MAFWELGDGPNLLHLPWSPWGHAQLEWQDPELILWYERLTSFCHLIRYDGRGTGLSDWQAPDYGIEGQIKDMEAVVNRLQPERFGILASLNMGPAAITFAARHPEQVTCLMLWCTYASSADYYSSPKVAAIRTLLGTDWDLYTETGAHAFVGWPFSDAAHNLAGLMRQSTTELIAKKFYADMATADARPLLTTLKVPTLVMHPRGYPLIDVAAASRLAAAIPDGRLQLFEGLSLSPTRGDLDGVVAAIRDLLIETQTRSDAPAPEASRTSDNLSQREMEVLRLIVQGMSNRDIAETLVISPRTVERHVENIYAKADISNRAQAVAYALSNNLV